MRERHQRCRYSPAFYQRPDHRNQKSKRHREPPAPPRVSFAHLSVSLTPAWLPIRLQIARRYVIARHDAGTRRKTTADILACAQSL
jgi:hypothetical protein